MNDSPLLSRRALMAGVASLLASRRPSGAAEPFAQADVRRRAELLARQPFAGYGSALPEWARSWGYEEYREFAFDPRRALWHSEGLRFEIDFFARGASFGVPVTIHVVEPGGIRSLPFDSSLFRRWPPRTPAVPDVLGFAGLRLRYPLIAGPPSHQECVVFLGASYFRGVGRGQVYGVSARGLAIDTATARPEEFPAFREFWLVRPERNAEDIRIFALLDGPSLTGAYEFHIGPGDDTVIGVTAEISRAGRSESSAFVLYRACTCSVSSRATASTTSGQKYTIRTACSCRRAARNGSGGPSTTPLASG